MFIKFANDNSFEVQSVISGNMRKYIFLASAFVFLSEQTQTSSHPKFGWQYKFVYKFLPCDSNIVIMFCFLEHFSQVEILFINGIPLDGNLVFCRKKSVCENVPTGCMVIAKWWNRFNHFSEIFKCSFCYFILFLYYLKLTKTLQ